MPVALRILLVAAGVGAVLWLTASVKSALTPFALAVVFSYVTAPLATKMESRGLPPAVAAGVILLLLFALLAAVPFALLPLMAAQLQDIVALLPEILDKLEKRLGGSVIVALKERVFQIEGADLDSAKQALNIVARLFGDGLALLGGLASILLITPLATFYFLRDRTSISGELVEILPPNQREHAISIGRDLDNVLGEFLHGQLLVMLIMATFYSLALKLAGLEFAVTIGVISGLLVFIPYVGFILGLLLATLVALGDFQNWWNLVLIWALMGIGTTLESAIITPRLVGERVGLHPLAVLLSLMVMGELFGFLGLLISLPAAAVLLVCGRYLRRFYINSDFYRQW